MSGLTKFQVGDIFILSNKFFTKICKVVIIDYKASRYHLIVLYSNKKDPMDWLGLESVGEQRAVKIDKKHPAWVLYVQGEQ